MIYTDKQVSAILNEWVRKYAIAPEEFGSLLDANNMPYLTYGDTGAAYFKVLYRELGYSND